MRAAAVSYTHLDVYKRQVYNSAGDYPRAHDYYKQAIAIFEKTSPDHDQDIGVILNNLAMLLRRTGDSITAHAYLERALTILSKSNEEPANVAAVLSNLADIALDSGEMQRAEKLLDVYKRQPYNSSKNITIVST